ncbi:MAG: single-stranded-DNA-specific exonuclease RecJ [Pirellulaceae bacterium]|nr:single-stranded-DNA-specific exonuclease RecJ [Pirellulaceae bacterium]
MQRRWRWIPSDTRALDDLMQSADVSAIVAQMLLARGVSEASAISAFLDPKLTDLRDPELLPGLSVAADKLYASISQKRSIVIYGDYDADGMTAASILVCCLRMLNADVSYYVPNRLEDGYGLSSDALRKLAERGKQTIVSVDCGIGSIAEAALCRELGLELIITDHHQIGAQLPDAAAIVHPALPGSNYPFHGLCGAGVAFKLAWGLCQRHSNSIRVRPELREFLMQAIGLAAIGTIADVVPLLDENRALVKHGLLSLHKRPCIGLQALMKVAKMTGKSELSSENVAFGIAPRLNAAGRLGQAQLAVELMTTRDSVRAEALAVYIDKLNADRETLDRSVQLAATKQAKEQYDIENDPALVLAAPGWHVGVIGIVAGRLAERFHRPTIVISMDPIGKNPATGSARSAGCVDLHATLERCRDHLVTFGGHAAAAGLKVEEANLAMFRQAFCEAVAEQTGSTPKAPEVVIDAQTVLNQLDRATIEQIEKMAPFGAQNHRPILAATNVTLAEPPKTMGNGDRHFTGRFVQHGTTLRGVAFGQADWVAPLTEHRGPIDIAFRPVINEFNGMRRVEIQLVDWRVSSPTAHKCTAISIASL